MKCIGDMAVCAVLPATKEDMTRSRARTRRVPELGDYVMGSKYHDGDPCDPFCVGFFAGMLPRFFRNDEPRFLIVDNNGLPYRANGYRRCELITVDTGNLMVSIMPKITDVRGKSVWHWRYNPKEAVRLLIGSINY